MRPRPPAPPIAVSGAPAAPGRPPRSTATSAYRPCAPAHAGLTPPGAQPTLARRMSARILVVDDDPWILRMVTASLRKRQFIVDTAREGRQALDRVKAHVPDVII